MGTPLLSSLFLIQDLFLAFLFLLTVCVCVMGKGLRISITDKAKRIERIGKIRYSTLVVVVVEESRLYAVTSMWTIGYKKEICPLRSYGII